MCERLRGGDAAWCRLGKAEAAPGATMRPPHPSAAISGQVCPNHGECGAELPVLSGQHRIGAGWGRTHAATVHKTGVWFKRLAACHAGRSSPSLLGSN